MIEYTKQKEFGRFGERWGCFFTCLVNIVERELGRKLSKIEKYAVVGICDINELIASANYKNRNSLHNELPGWSETADPEWHYYIFKDFHIPLSGILSLFGMSLEGLTREYSIHELKTAYGSHFVLHIVGEGDINPDPNLTGSLIDVRPVNV